MITNFIHQLLNEQPVVPIIQGIIYPNGMIQNFKVEYGMLANKIEFNLIEKFSIEEYFKSKGLESVSHCYVTNSMEFNELKVFVGEGSWGGDGFVYLLNKNKGELMWFLFSDTSNPFHKVEINDSCVIAFSTLDKKWIIPIKSPEGFSIENLFHEPPTLG